MDCNYDNVGRWISVIYRQFQVYINNELKDFNINSSQYIFLVNLYIQDGINQEELASSLFIDKGATARAIKQLEDNGYIERKVNPQDKRAYKVYVTEKALSIKSDITEILDKWNETLSADLKEDEIKILIKSLKNMSSNVLIHNKKLSK